MRWWRPLCRTRPRDRAVPALATEERGAPGPNSLVRTWQSSSPGHRPDPLRRHLRQSRDGGAAPPIASLNERVAVRATVRRVCTPNGETMTNLLDWPLDLPCGATLSNRVVKAAMSEGLADSGNHSTPRLETLYRRWAGSRAGLLLSGNIQGDRWHLAPPNNIVLHDT